MEGETTFEEIETPAIVVGGGLEKAPETADGKTGEGEGLKVPQEGEVREAGEGVAEVGETGENVKGEQVEGEHVEGEHVEGEHVEGEHVEGEHVAGEHLEGEHVEGEHVEGEHVVGEHVGGEHVEGEHVEGEHVEDEHVEGDHVEREHVEGIQVEGEHIEGEQAEGEELMGEGSEGEQIEREENIEEVKPALPEEEEEFVPEPPPDPAAPYNLSDSNEALAAPFILRPDQLAEVEQLWELYQNFNPAYTDLDGYITEKELVYMLKCLFIMTYTEEQLQELIAYCCRPPHEKGHIFYEQFLKMVTIRQRSFPVEEEIRCALQVYDPEKSGIVDREYLRENLQKKGHKMSSRLVDNLIKEIDMANDGTINIEDVVGSMCIDLNQDDLEMLRNSLFPKKEVESIDNELDEDNV